MKYILIFILFTIAVGCKAQRLDIKVLSGITHIIRQDTSESGVVTITKTPIFEYQKEIESSENSLKGEKDNLNLQIDAIRARIKEINYQLNQWAAIRTKLGI